MPWPMPSSRSSGPSSPRRAAELSIARRAVSSLVDAVCELKAAHQREDPHADSVCSNCTRVRAALRDAEATLE